MVEEEFNALSDGMRESYDAGTPAGLTAANAAATPPTAPRNRLLGDY